MSKEIVSVTFVNTANDSILCVRDVPIFELPENFIKKTTIRTNNADWDVLSAKPLTAAEFSETGQLSLFLRRVDNYNPEKDSLYSFPTIARELPEFTNIPMFYGFDENIHDSMWRQCEFLNTALFNQIEEETTNIMNVWKRHCVDTDDFSAFSTCYIRDIGEPFLNVSFDKLKSILDVTETGTLILGNNMVLNGFALRTKAGIYYGIVEDCRVTTLCSLDPLGAENQQEIYAIKDAFNLLFVSWCTCNID